MASEEEAQYACDRCRARKVSCSREFSGCGRCKSEAADCSYSRSGIIRRKRKRNATPPQAQHTVLTRPQLADDLTSTHERLSRLAGKEHQSFKALGALFEEYRSMWHDTSMIDRLAKESATQFFLHERQAESWAEALTTTLRKKGLPVASAPPGVLENLAACRPGLVPRAWLIMFYSIAFGAESARDEPDETTKSELRSNIWLAFNDMRVIIDADITNLQALLVLATQITEFMTPSLCWNLVTNACVMLQALGVTHRHIDTPLREQRSVIFWRLNIFDKAMALTMARPPVFHHDTVRKIAMPTLEQLLPSNSIGQPSLFHAHFVHQIMLLSQVMGDIWQCVYGIEASDSRAIIAAKDQLESWNSNAVQILEATTIVEKPFLAPDGIRAIDQGLETLRFHYRFLLILLCRCHKSLRGQCTEVSQDMLRSLEQLMSNTNEQYGALIWQLLHYPFFVFMALFGEILLTGKNQLQTNQKSLECMEHLPDFLNRFRRRTSLAVKMESVATRVIEQAKSWLNGQGDAAQPSDDQARSSTSTPPETTSPLMALLTPAATTDASSAYVLGSSDSNIDGLYSWDVDFLFNGAADWFKLDELV